MWMLCVRSGVLQGLPGQRQPPQRLHPRAMVPHPRQQPQHLLRAHNLQPQTPFHHPLTNCGSQKAVGRRHPRVGGRARVRLATILRCDVLRRAEDQARSEGVRGAFLLPEVTSRSELRGIDSTRMQRGVLSHSRLLFDNTQSQHANCFVQHSDARREHCRREDEQLP